MSKQQQQTEMISSLTVCYLCKEQLLESGSMAIGKYFVRVEDD